MSFRLPPLPDKHYTIAADRAQRAADYSRWTGARLVAAGEDGLTVQPLDAQALERRRSQEAAQIFQEIRTALAMGSPRVDCTSPDRVVKEYLEQMLTAAERERVHFTYFDVPIPTTTHHVRD